MGRSEFLKDKPKIMAPEVESRRWLLPIMSSKWLVLLILLLAWIVWYGFYVIHTKEIAGSDDREYASIARNIVHGKGIVRNFIYPVDINFFEKLPVPEFVHPPGYPLILAGFFKLFGISDFSALFPSYLSYFLLVLLVYFFASRYLGMKTAIIATVILIFNKDLLDISIVALSEAVYTPIFFLFFYLLVKAKTLRAIFLAGIILGVSHVIRENIYAFLIPLSIYLYFYPELPRWKKMIFFGIGILIPVIPNIMRSLSETGSPFFSYAKFTLMAFTEKFPWLNVYRDIQNPSLFEYLTEQPGQFILKYLNNWVLTSEKIMSFSNPYLLAFFMVEMFYWKIDQQWKKAKILFLILLASQIFFISLFTFTQRYFIPFLPMMAIFASQSFIRISEGLVSATKDYWRNGASILILILFCVFFILPSTYLIIKPIGPPMLNIKTLQVSFLIPRGEANQLNDFLKKELKENQVVWTDLPEILEWEGNRLCGWLPTRIEKIYEIHKRIPVDAILLTNLQTAKMEEEWRYLLFSGHSLPRYRNVKLYKNRAVFAKLLIRDEAE